MAIGYQIITLSAVLALANNIPPPDAFQKCTAMKRNTVRVLLPQLWSRTSAGPLCCLAPLCPLVAGEIKKNNPPKPKPNKKSREAGHLAR